MKAVELGVIQFSREEKAWLDVLSGKASLGRQAHLKRIEEGRKQQNETSEHDPKTDTSTTGRKIIPGTESWFRKASPDDPIYKRGYVVGGRILKGSSKNAQEKDSSNGKEKPED